MMYLAVFVVSGAVVVAAAAAMTRYADAIADRTGLGRLWVGSVLLAGATSLPELATDITAVRIGATDLAVGDLFGSSMANMLLLALVDLLVPRARVLARAALDHALVAALAISLNAAGAALVLFRPHSLTLGALGPGSVILFAGYLLGMRALARNAASRGEHPAPATPSDGRRLAEAPRRPILGFSLAAIVVLGSAPAFAWAAEGIATTTGLGHTFVGTWLVGLATSLPELVAGVTAARLDAVDLAVGNLFGSNAFNMAIFLALDLAQPGDVFADLHPGHALSGLVAVALMGVGLGSIVFRAAPRVPFLEPDARVMLVGYGLGVALLYVHTAGP